MSEKLWTVNYFIRANSEEIVSQKEIQELNNLFLSQIPLKFSALAIQKDIDYGNRKIDFYLQILRPFPLLEKEDEIMPEMKEMAEAHTAAAKVYSLVNSLNEAIQEAGHLKLTVGIEQDITVIETGPAAGHKVPYVIAKVLIEL